MGCPNTFGQCEQSKQPSLIFHTLSVVLACVHGSLLGVCGRVKHLWTWVSDLVIHLNVNDYRNMRAPSRPSSLSSMSSLKIISVLTLARHAGASSPRSDLPRYHVPFFHKVPGGHHDTEAGRVIWEMTDGRAGGGAACRHPGVSATARETRQEVVLERLKWKQCVVSLSRSMSIQYTVQGDFEVVLKIYTAKETFKCCKKIFLNTPEIIKIKIRSNVGPFGT